jgi:hypothetical protein
VELPLGSGILEITSWTVPAIRYDYGVKNDCVDIFLINQKGNWNYGILVMD